MAVAVVEERRFLHWSSWTDQPDVIELDTRTHWKVSNYWSQKTSMKTEERDEHLTVGNVHVDKNHPFARFVNHLRSVAKANSELLKEYIFDEVRSLEYPQLPSRRRCAFLFDASHDPHEYARALGFASSTLYEVEVVEGSLHRAKLSLLNCNTLSPPELRDQARRYWQCAEAGLDTEVLFEGLMRLRRLP